MGMLHKIGPFLTGEPDREERCAKFRLDTEREIEAHGIQDDGRPLALRPINIGFYYTGEQLATVAVEGVLINRQRAYREDGDGKYVTAMNFYDSEAEVPSWIIDLVEDQIDGSGPNGPGVRQ